MSHAQVFWLLPLLPAMLVFGIVVGRMSVYARFWPELRGKTRPALRVHEKDYFLVTEREYEKLRDLGWLEYIDLEER